MRLLLAVLAGVIGASIGSFLGVVCVRVPRGESVLYPASHCSTCLRPLRLWENIPILSWIALGGRCRTCRTPIGVNTVLLETGLGLLTAILTWICLS